MLNKKTVDDLKDLKGKKVLVRCDFNVPLKDGVIQNYNRIDGALPTIKKLLDQGAKVILCSHLGKPKGEPLPEMSLAPVAPALSERLGVPVKFISDPQVTGEETRKAAADLKDGEVLLLENTRYRGEETKYGKDEAAEKYAEELAALCDDGIFVDDAFGTAHRAHCSNVGVTKYCKENVVGYLMEKEIRFLGQAVENPVRPFVAILGGAKVSDKLNVINNLLDKVDTLIIGGGMAYTFLKAEGQSIGNSLCEEDKLSYCLDMLKKAEEKGVKLLLPVDHVAAEKFAADAPHKVVDEIPEGYLGLDIGPKSIARSTEALQGAKTVVWNGPMGVFEFEAFAAGTLAICKAVAELKDATTVVGGGDSVNAVKRPGEKIFPYIQKNLDGIITIQDNELIVSFLDMVENHKMIVENSGLLTVAALKHLDVENKKIVSILSGGNMDVITMASLIQHGLIQRDRIFTVSVLLPDKPGQLARVAEVIAEESGNVIKLEHNQFVSINRNAAVELRITMEAFGTEHKEKICERLKKEGYRPKLVRSKGTYGE